MDIRSGRFLAVLIAAVLVLGVSCAGTARAEDDIDQGISMGYNALVDDGAPLTRIYVPMTSGTVETLVNPDMAEAYRRYLAKIGGADSVDSSGALHDRQDQIEGIMASTNAVLRGFHNSFYITTADMPITKYLLGMLTVNTNEIVNLQQTTLEAFKNIPGTYQNTAAIEEMIATAQGTTTQIDSFMNTRGNQFMKILYGPIPQALLMVMLLLQLANVAYTQFVNPRQAQRIFVTGIVFRYIAFVILLLCFKKLVCVTLDLSNYASLYFLSEMDQAKLQTWLVHHIVAFAPVDQSLMKTVIEYCFRILSYVCVKVLIIMRDIMVALTIIVGPTCVAIGFFHNYAAEGGNDPMRGYLSGWLQGYVKLLFWGPLAAMMIMAMTVVSIMNVGAISDTFSVAVTGLAFLYAAARLPNLAESMSGLILQALFMKVASLMGGAVMGGAVAMTGASVVMGGSFLSLIKGAKGGSALTRGGGAAGATAAALSSMRGMGPGSGGPGTKPKGKGLGPMGGGSAVPGGTVKPAAGTKGGFSKRELPQGTPFDPKDVAKWQRDRGGLASILTPGKRAALGATVAGREIYTFGRVSDGSLVLDARNRAIRSQAGRYLVLRGTVDANGKSVMTAQFENLADKQMRAMQGLSSFGRTPATIMGPEDQTFKSFARPLSGDLAVGRDGRAIMKDGKVLQIIGEKDGRWLSEFVDAGQFTPSKAGENGFFLDSRGMVHNQKFGSAGGTVFGPGGKGVLLDGNSITHYGNLSEGTPIVDAFNNFVVDGNRVAVMGADGKSAVWADRGVILNRGFTAVSGNALPLRIGGAERDVYSAGRVGNGLAVLNPDGSENRSGDLVEVWTVDQRGALGTTWAKANEFTEWKGSHSQAPVRVYGRNEPVTTLSIPETGGSITTRGSITNGEYVVDGSGSLVYNDKNQVLTARLTEDGRVVGMFERPSSPVSIHRNLEAQVPGIVRETGVSGGEMVRHMGPIVDGAPILGEDGSPQRGEGGTFRVWDTSEGCLRTRFVPGNEMTRFQGRHGESVMIARDVAERTATSGYDVVLNLESGSQTYHQPGFLVEGSLIKDNEGNFVQTGGVPLGVCLHEDGRIASAPVSFEDVTTLDRAPLAGLPQEVVLDVPDIGRVEHYGAVGNLVPVVTREGESIARPDGAILVMRTEGGRIESGWARPGELSESSGCEALYGETVLRHDGNFVDGGIMIDPGTGTPYRTEDKQYLVMERRGDRIEAVPVSPDTLVDSSRFRLDSVPFHGYQEEMDGIVYGPEGGFLIYGGDGRELQDGMGRPMVTYGDPRPGNLVLNEYGAPVRDGNGNPVVIPDTPMGNEQGRAYVTNVVQANQDPWYVRAGKLIMTAGDKVNQGYVHGAENHVDVADRPEVRPYDGDRA
jgi:hypothetical protein